MSGETFDCLHWTLSFTLAAAIAVVAWRRDRGATRAMRRWFAIGLVGSLIGQLLWDLEGLRGARVFPALSDLGYVSLGPAFALGLWTQVREAPAAERRAARLDLIAITVAILILTLALYLPRRNDAPIDELVVLTAYPVLMLLPAVVAGIAMLHGRLCPSGWWVVLMLASVANGAAWMIYNGMQLDGVPPDGTLLNLAFTVTMVAIGIAVAAWRPRTPRVRIPAVEAANRALPVLLAVLGTVAVCFGIATPATGAIVCVGSVIVVGLAVVRQNLQLVERDTLVVVQRERADLETRMMQSQRLETLGVLAGGIAHDLNNILMAIWGHAQLLEDEPLDADGRDSVSDIEVGCARGRDIVKRVLAFSRAREIEPLPVRIDQVITEVVGLFRAAVPASITLKVSPPRGRPMVLADPAQLHQVLLNLATNAAQAIGTRRGTIEISGMQRGETVELVVRDDGCGMDPETRARIFEPFFTTKGPDRGTGLGLAVVNGAVRAMGGTIDVTSTPDAGACFRVILPRLKSPESAEREVIGIEPRGDGREILVVDDDLAVSGVLVRALRRIGWRATAVVDPDYVLGLLGRQPNRFAALITDLSMPRMSGLELARRTRALLPDLPIFLATGSPDDQADAIEHGVTEVLAKPFSRHALALALARSLGLLDDGEPLAA